jgi:4-amino-4-deoxy-L-arabinose transferase-like glycosyltransferase
VVPWYAAVYAEHGWHYIKAFLLDDNISRYTQPVWGPRRSVFFYLPVLAGDLLPWSVFLPLAIWPHLRLKLRQWKAPRLSPDGSPMAVNAPHESEQGERPFGMLLLIWIAVIVIFFSLSRNKEDLYVLPVYPAVAALVGGLLARALNRVRTRGLTTSVSAAALLVAGLGIALLYVIEKLSDVYQIAGAPMIAWMAIAGGLFAAVGVSARRADLGIVVLALTMAAISWVFVLLSLPNFERYRPVRALSEVIARQAGPDARVGYFRTASPSMVFYLQRPIFEYYRAEELSEAMASGQDVYCLIAAEEYESVKDVLGVRTIVLASRPIFQVKLGGIFNRTRTPQVLLISNKLGARSSE